MKKTKINKNNKYGSSIDGLKCIGPCYDKYSNIVHPHTLDVIKNFDVPSCPIMPTVIDNELQYIDACHFTRRVNNTNSILTPIMDFDDKYFLNTIYNIYSYEDTMVYLNKFKLSPPGTRLRIVSCMWSVYGNNIKYIDDILTDFYIDVITELWLDSLYNILYKYIQYDASIKKIIINKSLDSDDANNKKIYKQKLRKKFILDKYITKENIYIVLVKYIKYAPYTADSSKVSDLSHKVLKTEIFNYIKSIVLANN